MKASLLLILLPVAPLLAGELALDAPIPDSDSVTGIRFFTGEQELDFEYEALLTDDIQVNRGAFRYSQRRGDWTFDLRLSQIDYALDYQPFAPLGGIARSLDETTRQASLGIGYALSDSLETTLTFNTYDGFADFRSIWIAEYYRQAFNFPGSGYAAPDPHGFSFTSGWQWNPKAGTRLSMDLTYAEDTIAPGWSFQEPGNDLLKNRAVSLRWEQALNPRLKTETSFTYFDITDRDPRMILQSSWNFAATDDLTLGANIGGSREAPDFRAFYGGVSATYEVNAKLSLRAEARLYSDTGEIETSGFNASAPGVDTSEIGLSAFYENGAHSLRLSVARYLTSFGAPDPENEFFTNLYEDRDWWTLRTAYSFRF